jgi:hypothetical protein
VQTSLPSSRRASGLGVGDEQEGFAVTFLSAHSGTGGMPQLLNLQPLSHRHTAHPRSRPPSAHGMDSSRPPSALGSARLIMRSSRSSEGMHAPLQSQEGSTPAQAQAPAPSTDPTPAGAPVAASHTRSDAAMDEGLFDMCALEQSDKESAAAEMSAAHRGNMDAKDGSDTRMDRLNHSGVSHVSGVSVCVREFAWAWGVFLCVCVRACSSSIGGS